MNCSVRNTTSAINPLGNKDVGPKTHLNITTLIEIDLVLEFLLDLAGGGAASPSPDVVRGFLLAIQRGRHAPDDQVAEHDGPREKRGYVGGFVGALDAAAQVAYEDAEIEGR